jgi:CheY-like chemotaxis protein
MEKYFTLRNNNFIVILSISNLNSRMDNNLNNKRKFKILIAEDNILNQKLIVAILTKREFEVVTAKNGDEACKLFQLEKPDLILMDVEMPYVNGYEAVSKIREMEKDTNMHIPIIALTGHYLQEDINNVYNCGMDDYILKPINFDEFFEKLLYFLS